jgi:ABC-type spermidine/putrescine transport system permease subunit I
MTAKAGRTALFVLPALALVALGFALPLAQTLLRSVFDPGFTTENFAQLLGTASYARVLLNSFSIAAVCTLLALLIGFPFALILARAKGWAHALLMASLLLPLWTSDLVRAFSWLVLLGRRGPVNTALIVVGLTDRPLPLLFNLFGVIVGSVHIMLPFMILPIYNSLRTIDPRLYQAALGLGARPTAAVLRVYVPLGMPGIAAGSLLVFVLATGLYITPATLGGPEQTMIAQLIESAGRVSLDFGLASALAVMLLVGAAGMGLLYAAVIRAFAGLARAAG